MVVDHHPSQYLSTVRGADDYDRGAHDVHHADVDDDVEKTSVTHSVDSRLLYAPDAHSTLSMQFVVFVPCRARQCPALTPRTSMTSKKNYSMAHVAV